MTSTQARTHLADALKVLSILGTPDVEVLDVLGLITGEPGARRVADVDPSVVPPPSNIQATIVPSGATWQPPERQRKGFTTPEGLRNLPPASITQGKGQGKGKGHGNATFALLEANDRKKAACGTKSAWSRHQRNGETCEVCDTAEQQRKDTSPRRRPKCGDPGGLMAHRYRQETVCSPCREAHNRKQRERKAELRTATIRTEQEDQT